MTVFTPVKPVWGQLWTRAVFIWVRASATGTPDIHTLSFIHFARWGLIRRLPDFGQPRERLRHPLFMFESNYNGSFEAYIDAFAQVLGKGMSAFWGSSYGFPGPLPVRPFKEYIRANEFVTAHYYSAYPTASVDSWRDEAAGDLTLITVPDPESSSAYVFAISNGESVVDMLQWGPADWIGTQWGHLCSGL